MVNGSGLVYSHGQYVEGYSNFSWVMIQALLMRLHLPIITSIKLLGLASAVATALLSFFLARRVHRRRGDLWWIMLLAALLIPYEAWRLSYYGKLLPNTYAAKIGGPELDNIGSFFAKLTRQPLMIRFVTRQGWGFIALLILAAIGCIAGLRRLPMFAWLPTACGLLLVLHASHGWMPRYRLVVPIMPCLSILVGYSFAELLRRIRRFPEYEKRPKQRLAR